MTIFKKLVAATALTLLPLVALAQGKIAVVNLEAAILQSDYAQQRLAEFEANEDFMADKSQYEKVVAEIKEIQANFERDQAAMSEDQKVAARQKLASKQSDLEYVVKKLQAMQQQNAQRVFQELAPKAQEVLQQVIATEQIGLLLSRQAVLHADMGYDVTAKVTDKLNQLPAAQ